MNFAQCSTSLLFRKSRISEANNAIGKIGNDSQTTTKIQEELIGENTTNTEEVEIHVSEKTILPPGPCGPQGERLRVFAQFSTSLHFRKPRISKANNAIKKIGSDSQTITKIREELIGENTSNEAATASEEVEIHMSEEH